MNQTTGRNGWNAASRLIYMPLGGAGEIGMNAYVYGWGAPGEERLIVVDLGVTFPDMDTTPGVDLIFADLDWLYANRDRIEAIFITHAHEDHIGALGLTWGRLRAPVHTRRFTGLIAERKMEERGHATDALRITAPWPEMVEAGPFRVGFAPISHSIPESSALVIDTPVGRVVHSGDFKIDETPLVGEPFDWAMWREITKGGIHALVCDSTNIFSPDPGRSEASIKSELTRMIAAQTGMVTATTFASNVARVKTLAEAGQAAGRSIVLLGRAMRRMVEAAVEAGVLTDFPKTVPPEDAANIPRENLMLIVTGSQGERRAASAQLSRGKYMGLSLTDGDTFLFSSKTIPGNEAGVIRIMNALSEMGVDVVDDTGGLYHVSGHANRPDIERVHEVFAPKMVVPMHGEHRHLRAHVKLAEAKGIASILAVNGMMIDLTNDRPGVAEFVETGRTYLDGSAQIGAMDGVVRDRIRMALNGLVVVTLLVEDDEALGDPWVDIKGLPDTGDSGADLAEVLEEELSQFIGRAKRKTLADEEGLEKEITRIVRQTAQAEIDKKPEIVVIVSRLG